MILFIWSYLAIVIVATAELTRPFVTVASENKASAMPTMSLDPFGDKWAIASSEEVSSPEPIQKRAGLTEMTSSMCTCRRWTERSRQLVEALYGLAWDERRIHYA